MKTAVNAPHINLSQVRSPNILSPSLCMLSAASYSYVRHAITVAVQYDRADFAAHLIIGTIHAAPLGDLLSRLVLIRNSIFLLSRAGRLLFFGLIHSLPVYLFKLLLIIS
jgi:hypothetical protein